MDIAYRRFQFELPDGTEETCIAAEKHGVEGICGVYFFAAQLARGPWTVVHTRFWCHVKYKRIDPLPLFDTPEEAHLYAQLLNSSYGYETTRKEHHENQ